jgi:hypothetical protein
MFAQGIYPYEPEYRGCECEMDWNCGCGRYGGATWIETRYQDDEPAEREMPYWAEVREAMGVEGW